MLTNETTDFDTIVYEIMPLLKNGCTPEKQTIIIGLDDIGEKTGNSWRLKLKEKCYLTLHKKYILIYTMEKHFCTCTVTDCQNHPSNHNRGCDACVQKNLKLGEVPACIWNNVSVGVIGATEWSMGNFAKFYAEHTSKQL